jgi:flotillin
MEQSLDANVKKKAEAEKFAKQQQADAELYERQREAEAKQFEYEKEAEAMKKQAEAKRFTMEQEAEGVRTKGIAEAEAIRAKAIAEAEGIEKKAEAMAKMGDAAVLEMYFKALPEVVKNAAAPLANVDRITMYGDGNSAKLMKDVMSTVVQVTDGLKESTGVDLQAVLSGFLAGKAANVSAENKGASKDKPLDEIQNV